MMQLRRGNHHCPSVYSHAVQAWQRELASLQVDMIMLDPVADHREARLMCFLPGWKLDFRSREAVIYVRQSTDHTGCAHQGLC